MIPLLSLGIPGSSTAAILLGALTLHGLTPGPSLFMKNINIDYGIFGAMFLANIALVIFGLLGIRVFALVTKIPYKILGPIILLISILGCYSVTNQIIGVWLLFVFGVLGYILQKFNFPLAPMILGLILGPIIEINFRRAFYLSGSLGEILTRPITASIFILIFIFIVVMPVYNWVSAKHKENQLSHAE
jgi:putative tricarboxylic transport membrane protein